MSGWTKLQSSIVHSTIWREPHHVRIVWITMLALCDSKGRIEGSIPGLADISRVSMEECLDALKKLLSPDEWSRDPDNGGRRIEEVPGGWEVLNYEKYRDPTSTQRVRQHREREKQKETNETVPPVSKRLEHQVTHETPSESDPDPDTEEQPIIKIKRDNTSKIKYEEITRKYLEIFNAVFDRRGMPVKTLNPVVEKRIKAGVEPWQLYAAPILLSLSSVNRGLFIRPNLNEILLRDGTRDVRGPNGNSPGVNWIRDLVLGIDTVTLDERTTEIARYFGIFGDLENKVKGYA